MMRDMRAAVGMAAFFLCAALALAQRAPGAPQLGSEVTSGGGGGGGDITAVGDCTTGSCLTSGTTTMAGNAVFQGTNATQGVHSFGSAAQATISAAGAVTTTSTLSTTAGGTIGMTNSNGSYARFANSTGGIIQMRRDFGTTFEIVSGLISSVEHYQVRTTAAGGGGLSLEAPVSFALRLTGNLSVGVVSPASLSGNVTDYTGCATASMCRINDGGSARTINSMSINHTSSTAHAPIMNICSVGSNDLTLLHDDGSTGTAAMRFTFNGPTNRTVKAGSCFPVIYDPTTARWRAANGT